MEAHEGQERTWQAVETSASVQGLRELVPQSPVHVLQQGQVPCVLCSKGASQHALAQHVFLSPACQSVHLHPCNQN